MLTAVAVLAAGCAGGAATAVASARRGVDPGPSLETHWHMPVAVWVCTGFSVRPLADVGPTRTGVHTHEDGLIHVHPYVEEATGAAATLGLFSEEVGLELSDGGFVSPDGFRVTEAVQCPAGPARAAVLRWAPEAAVTDPPEVLLEGLAEVPLNRDGTAFVIAFAPEEVLATVPHPQRGTEVPVGQAD